MMQHDNPTPKTQREISVSLQQPYAKANLGNPNDSFSNGRATQLSVRGDNVKPFVLGIEDIDAAIKYHIEERIKPFVYQNGEKLNVPVIYGNPEKWHATQKNGHLRDSAGKLMCPLIIYKRDSVEKVRTVGNKLDANMPNLYASAMQSYTRENTYSNFDALNNRKPVKQSYLTVVPDYVTVSYSCIAMTYRMVDLNRVIEALNYASDAYWGDPQGFKFKASIASFDLAVESDIDKERIARTTFNLVVNAHLVPDTVQKDLNSTKKALSKAQVVVLTETTGSI